MSNDFLEDLGNGVKLEMVFVKGNSSDINDFYIGKYVITQEQWVKIMNTRPWSPKEKQGGGLFANYEKFAGDRLPAIRVSFDDVRTFLEALSRNTKKNYRLPNENEWRYAACGGESSNTYQYSGSNSIDEVSWYSDNSENVVHEVGSKKPNELGLYDMSGNVYEWIDRPAKPDTVLMEINKGSEDVNYSYLGGSYDSGEIECRVSCNIIERGHGHCQLNLGFRVACSA